MISIIGLKINNITLIFKCFKNLARSRAERLVLLRTVTYAPSFLLNKFPYNLQYFYYSKTTLKCFAVQAYYQKVKFCKIMLIPIAIFEESRGTLPLNRCLLEFY